jgi:hypothetical protein
MSLENGSDFIKFPTHENFPLIGYTLNSISNEFGTALYITGGMLYSKNDETYTANNSLYRYNFMSKGWVDMTYTIGAKLNPLAEHKSAVIDSRYLVILGGRSQIGFPKFGFNPLYNLTIFDTFTNNWEIVRISASVFDTHITTLKFIDFSVVAYNDKIIVFGGIAGENQSKFYQPSRHLGIFDFKSKIWNWSPILNEDGSSYKPAKESRNILVFKDQFIVCTGKLSFII